MPKIKQIPEDFIVKEVSEIKSQANGQYAYFLLKKTNYTTIDALQTLSKKLKMPLKHFGFAGNKDRNAITEQKISVFRGNKNFGNVKLKNIELGYIGNGKKPISLGDLKGNEFVITIRSLDNKYIEKIKKLQNKKLKIPNLFGPQRFSKNNPLAGKAIIKRDFKKSVELILENEGFIEDKIKQCIENNKNNYIEALRQIPLKTRKLLVHSYQSFLFNKIIIEYLQKNSPSKNFFDKAIPLIGFGFELNSIKNSTLRDIVQKILNEERISPRDFIISQMPELASEGGSRDLFFELNDLKIIEIADDELNQKKQKIKVNFTLPRSCYATVALEFFLQ